MMTDPLETEFVKHVLKYRPDSVTAQLADKVTTLHSRWIRELERAEKLERRLAARERELERIRTTLYKDRVDEFEKIRKEER